MNTKNLLSWIALLLGIAVIVGAFLTFMNHTSQEVLVLNLSVSLLIYALFFMDVLIPWVDWKDKSKRSIGSIGLRWAVTWGYATLAIGTMLACNLLFDIVFSVQLILHGIFLIVLILGLTGTLHASDKVAAVYEREETLQAGVKDMRQCVSVLEQQMYDCPRLASSIPEKIKQLKEELRYLSPSDNSEAAALEQQFVRMIREIGMEMNTHPDNDRILALLDKAEYILKNRKSIYSL